MPHACKCSRSPRPGPDCALLTPQTPPPGDAIIRGGQRVASRPRTRCDFTEWRRRAKRRGGMGGRVARVSNARSGGRISGARLESEDYRDGGSTSGLRVPAAIRTGTSTTWLHRWAMYSRMSSGPSWSVERWKYCANYTPMLSQHGCERLSHDQPIVFFPRRRQFVCEK